MLDWLLEGLDDRPNHGLHLSVAGLLVIAWALTALSILAGCRAKRVKQATGVDVLGRGFEPR